MDRSKWKGIVGVVLIALMVCALSGAINPVSAELEGEETSMSISPSTQTVDPGESFDVNIVVDTTGLTRIAQCDLSFDPSMVQVDSVTEGTYYSDWASAHGGQTYFMAGTIDNSAGTIAMSGVSILGGDAGGQTGSGTFITIHMTAKTGVSGTSPLILPAEGVIADGVIIGDEDGQPIPDVVTNDGEVVIQESGTAPAVTTDAASSVADNSATLNATLDGLGTASSVNVSFEWGTTTAYGNETTQETMTSTGTFDANLSGLNSATTYHFRAKAVGDATGYGCDRSFVTTGTRGGEDSSSVNLMATILAAVSISVSPTEINFGELAPGDISDPYTLTVTNTGSQSVNVTAEVTGDSLYVDNNGLWLDSALWSAYQTTITRGQLRTTVARLHVGETYAGCGTQEGVLIFWAVATP